MVNRSELNQLPMTPRSELPLKLLPLSISQALEMALEQKELDQEPGAGRWVLRRTGLHRLKFSRMSNGWVGGMD